MNKTAESNPVEMNGSKEGMKQAAVDPLRRKLQNAGGFRDSYLAWRLPICKE
jgi:hypothetical protein